MAGRGEARTRAAADEAGIGKAYGDWRALLEDRNIDAVVIATPPLIAAGDRLRRA